MKLPIYNSELAIIRKLGLVDAQKIIFTILVWSKYNPLGVVPADKKEIMKLSGILTTMTRYDKLLEPILAIKEEDTKDCLLQLCHMQTAEGFIRPYYVVLFSEQNDEKKPKFYVPNVEGCIDYFNMYYEQRFFDKFKRYCEKCGRELEVKANNQKYCEACSIIVNKEYKTLKQRDYRRRSKVEKVIEDYKHEKAVEGTQKLLAYHERVRQAKEAEKRRMENSAFGIVEEKDKKKIEKTEKEKGEN